MQAFRILYDDVQDDLRNIKGFVSEDDEFSVYNAVQRLEAWERSADDLRQQMDQTEAQDDFDFALSYYELMTRMEQLSHQTEFMKLAITERCERKKLYSEVLHIVEPTHAFLSEKIGKREEDKRRPFIEGIEACESHGIEFESIMRDFFTSKPEIGDPMMEYHPSFSLSKDYKCKTLYPNHKIETLRKECENTRKSIKLEGNAEKDALEVFEESMDELTNKMNEAKNARSG